jgi:transcriptional regulator with XRE-family HTH domain
LAKHLGRTSAAVSDLERGKVQVTAVDLHKLGRFLEKPIEYFYGDDLGGLDILEIVFVLRQAPPEIRKRIIPGMKYSLRLIEIGEAVKITTDEQKLLHLITEYRSIMEALAKESQALSATMSEQNIEVQLKLAEVLNRLQKVLPEYPINEGQNRQGGGPRNKRKV